MNAITNHVITIINLFRTHLVPKEFHCVESSSNATARKRTFKIRDNHHKMKTEGK